MNDKTYRIEHDSMGELKVPDGALWGAQTQRAVDNFPISGLSMPRQFIAALGLVKWAAAGANAELGLLSNPLAIVDCCVSNQNSMEKGRRLSNQWRWQVFAKS